MNSAESFTDPASLGPITRALVPAAGLGTRLLPATRVQAKEMLPLGTTPVIQRVAEELLAAGIRQALVVTCPGKYAIGDHFDLRAGFGPRADEAHAQNGVFSPERFRLFYTRQAQPRGLADAVLCGREFAGAGPFVVALGDCIIVSGEQPALVERLIRAHQAHAAAATIAVQPVPPEATSRYGIVDIVEETEGVFRLQGIVEKPGPAQAPSNWAVTARYVFSPVLFSFLEGLEPGHGGELQLTDAIQAMISAGLPVLAVPLGEKEIRLDVGNKNSYGRAFIRTVLSDAEVGEQLRNYTARLLAFLEGRESADPDRWAE